MRIDTMHTSGRIYLATALIPAAIGSAALFPAAAEPPRRVLMEDRAPTAVGPVGGPETAVAAMKLRSVLGIEVRTEEGKSVGRIVDLLADRSGKVEAAVIEFGGFLGMGARKIAAAWPELRVEMSGDHTIAVIDMTPDELRAAPEYKADHPVVARKLIAPPPPPQAPTAQLPRPKQPTTQRRKRRHHTHASRG